MKAPTLVFTALALLFAAGHTAAQQGDQPEVVWTTVDIGNGWLGAQATAADCVSTECPAYSVQSNAEGFGATTDSVTFVQRPLVGDGEIVARLDAVADEEGQGMVGLAVRTSLGENAAGAAMVTTAQGEMLAVFRPLAGSNNRWATLVPAPATPQPWTPTWLKIERRGRDLSMLRSIDGTEWQVVALVRIPTSAVVYTGVVAASGNGSTLDVAVSGLHQQKSAGLPAYWTNNEIGGSDGTGYASYENSQFLVVHGAPSLGGVKDRFRLVQFRANGDVDLVTRVVPGSISAGGEAGLMIRESLADDAAHVFIAATPSGRFVTRRRIGTGVPATTTSVSGAAPGQAVWVRLIRRGTLVVTAQSIDGARWKLVSQDTLPLPTTTHIGLAISRSSGSGAAYARFDQLNGRVTIANRSPAVSLSGVISEAGGAITAGVPARIAASAADPDGFVGAVEFYVDNVRIGADTAAPYQALWANPTAGKRVLAAVAIDSEGVRVTSAPLTVSVGTGANLPGGGTNGGHAPTKPTDDTNWRVAFTPSADHAAVVDRYVLRVFSADLRSLAIAQDLGKPTVVDGVCTVDVSAAFVALPGGSYLATITAEDDETLTFSAPASVNFTR